MQKFPKGTKKKNHRPKITNDGSRSSGTSAPLAMPPMVMTAFRVLFFVYTSPSCHTFIYDVRRTRSIGECITFIIIRVSAYKKTHKIHACDLTFGEYVAPKHPARTHTSTQRNENREKNENSYKLNNNMTLTRPTDQPARRVQWYFLRSTYWFYS